VEEAEASGTPVSDREETRIPRGHGAIHLGTRSAT
jgi:hypothetical protein